MKFFKTTLFLAKPALIICVIATLSALVFAGCATSGSRSGEYESGGAGGGYGH